AADPDARYASAQHMRADLEQVVAAHAGLRADVSETAGLLGELFASERAKLRHILDGQLRAMRSASSAPVDVVSLERFSSEPPSSKTVPVAGAPSRPSSLSPIATNNDTRGAAGPSDHSDNEPPAEDPPRRLRAAAAVGIVLGAAIAVAAVVGTQDRYARPAHVH